jgi:hypothetical protein
MADDIGLNTAEQPPGHTLRYKIIVIIAVLLFLGAAGFAGYKRWLASPSGNAVKEEIIDLGWDVVDVNQGTIVVWTNENMQGRNEGLGQFFSSRKIPGLSIRYRFQDKRIVAGLPAMESSKQAVFDGQKHMIAYQYRKDGSQELFFDGELVASGSYSGIAQTAPIGMVIAYPPEELMPESVQTAPEAMDASEIQRLYALNKG